MKKIMITMLTGLFMAMTATTGLAAEQEVEYEVHGQKVLGTLVIPDQVAHPPVVLMLHGYTANRNESKSEFVPEGLFGQTAKKLEEKGVASLRIDMRGSGKSDGVFQDMTVESEVEDALAAVSYLKNNKAVDGGRISVMGLSLGGIVTTAVAGQSKTPIQSVVLWNPGINPPAAFMTMFGLDALRASVKDADTYYENSMGGHSLTMKGDFYRSLYRTVPAAELERYHGPVLLAIGTKDQIVWPQPISAEALLSYHPGKHELWTIPAGHTFDSDERDTAVNQVIEKTVSFIVEHN